MLTSTIFQNTSIHSIKHLKHHRQKKSSKHTNISLIEKQSLKLSHRCKITTRKTIDLPIKVQCRNIFHSKLIKICLLKYSNILQKLIKTYILKVMHSTIPNMIGRNKRKALGKSHKWLELSMTILPRCQVWFHHFLFQQLLSRRRQFNQIESIRPNLSKVRKGKKKIMV